MNYIVNTLKEASELRKELYASRGLGLLEIATVVVNPWAIDRVIAYNDALQKNRITTYTYVRKMIDEDIIIFPFGGRLIQYNLNDFKKVLVKFEDSVWGFSEDEREMLLNVIYMKQYKRRVA